MKDESHCIHKTVELESASDYITTTTSYCKDYNGLVGSTVHHKSLFIIWIITTERRARRILGIGSKKFVNFQQHVTERRINITLDSSSCPCSATVCWSTTFSAFLQSDMNSNWRLYTDWHKKCWNTERWNASPSGSLCYKGNNTGTVSLYISTDNVSNTTCIWHIY